MAVIIQGIDIPKKHYMNGYYISDDGKVFDVSRKTVVGKAVQIPSAQLERIRGRWIEKPHVHGVAYCSLCDYELHTNDTNFCPNCGADMRKREGNNV